MTTSTTTTGPGVRHVAHITDPDGNRIDVLEVEGARVTPVHWDLDPGATGRQIRSRYAICTVEDLSRPGSLPAVIQWHKRSPRSGAWLCGEFRFRTMTAAARHALAVIAAREGRFADGG